MTKTFDDLDERLAALDRRGLYRRRRIVDSPQGRRVEIDGRDLLNFSSNDYLGLASDRRVCDAFKAGVDRWGTGSGASHLISGHTAAHSELEEQLAEATGRERALLFGSGYAANVGTIHALVGARDQVFQDRLNHASLLDGGWLSRAECIWFDHANVEDLERQMSSQPASGRRLVVSDGVFSMDGDICPLDKLVRAARQSDAWLMIDDAHGFGGTGRDGCGTVDAEQYTSEDVPVLMATLGKAVGTAGAFVAGDTALIEFLIQRARHYIYSTAMPAAIACATRRSLQIIDEEPWRREHLTKLIARFRQQLAERDVKLPDSSCAIQPVIVGSSSLALQLSQQLMDVGLFVMPIRPPTVPAGTARLRITLTAAHSEQDIDRLVASLGDALQAIAPKSQLSLASD